MKIEINEKEQKGLENFLTTVAFCLNFFKRKEKHEEF